MNLDLMEVYSRDNLPNKIKDGAYVINLDKHYDIGTHWIALYGVDNIPKEIKKNALKRETFIF